VVPSAPTTGKLSAPVFGKSLILLFSNLQQPLTHVFRGASINVNFMEEPWNNMDIGVDISMGIKWLLIYSKKFDTLEEIILGSVPKNFAK